MSTNNCENTIDMSAFRAFMYTVSEKYNISYKALCQVWNDEIQPLNDDECRDVISKSKSKAKPTRQQDMESSGVCNESVIPTEFCVTVKKDGSICGKNATIGNTCSVHKPRTKGAVKTSPEPETVQEMITSCEIARAPPGTCDTVKKDGSICGKKATLGDKCGVHKPRNSTNANAAGSIAAFACDPVCAPADACETTRTLLPSVTCIAVKKDGSICGKKATIGNVCGVHKSYKGPAVKVVPEQVPLASETACASAGTCIAVKKDGSICGKKATIGNVCGVHKSYKGPAVKVVPEQVPLASCEPDKEVVTKTCQGVTKSGKRCNARAVCDGYCKLHRDQIPLPETKHVLKDVNLDKLEVNPRLGLLFDRTNSRFVFSKSTGNFVVIGRFSNRFTVLTEEDIQNCGLLGLEYKVVQMTELAPEFPLIDDEEYTVRIPYFIELDAQKSGGKSTVAEPVVEQGAEPVVEQVAEPPTGGRRVKNLKKDPSHFPKASKNVSNLDIVSALEEIIEPVLTDSQVQ